MRYTREIVIMRNYLAVIIINAVVALDLMTGSVRSL